MLTKSPKRNLHCLYLHECVALRERGVTLIELTMVIILMGILAVIALPRMFSNTDFYARGFHDETLALLRYAHKTAIAQRRTVCVTFSAPAPASATLSIASAAGVLACDSPLTGPNKSCTEGSISPISTTGCINARSNVSYSVSPMTLNFNGLGQPDKIFSTTIQVAHNGIPIALKIIIEAENGYVHD